MRPSHRRPTRRWPGLPARNPYVGNARLTYKTLRGAAIGDMYMSIIHTCYFARVSPIDYLTQLQRRHEKVHAAPANWMPWNYQRQLTATASAANPGCSPLGDSAASTSTPSGTA